MEREEDRTVVEPKISVKPNEQGCGLLSSKKLKIAKSISSLMCRY